MQDMCAPAKLFIGTAGWSYKHWKEVFYSPDLPQTQWLAFYARHYSTVEINNSFYRLPTRETFARWYEETPPEFVFSVKASRYITHVKKLTGIEDAWHKFIENAQGLQEKLGPILFQFPANLHINSMKLHGFLEMLPGDRRYAFEFRHPSWFTGEIYALLEETGAALVIADSPNWPEVIKITAPFTFIRMHGGKALYGSNYTLDELRMWAEKIAGFLDRRLDVYVYFNNDAFGYATINATQLTEFLTR
ncbi:MAG TPA: DUF72 domain-containing protein [Candidatus Aquicultor sp.]|jgi:uncharacterized protein YecE (DUF72 family)